MGPHPQELGATPGTPLPWEFQPRVSMAVLEGEVRVLAATYYTKVEQAMVSEIDRVVDTALQIYLSTLPRSIDEDVMKELHMVERLLV